MIQPPVRRIRYLTSIALVCLALVLMPSCSAQYDFEGIPLKIVANGEVTGDVLTFGKYGLQDPPVSLEFDIPGEVQWARTYVAVWGGTPRYTGWVGLDVNGAGVTKTSLFGKDDRNENVYVTGYGVYWVAYDTTSLCRHGRNTVTATTSRTDPDNKLDGRIYTVVTLVISRDMAGGSTSYWIAEGNENLHGEGWSGTNPTLHEEASITIPVPDATSILSANLSVLFLASGKGQPDYTLFNGKDLGSAVTDTAQYPSGARDIADETSFNAGYKSPIESRYVDMEVFDVKSLVKKGDNVVLFQRGRDLDGDGQITASGEKPEGEDYLHPVLVLLTLQKPRAVAITPDLMAETVVASDAFAGGTATISATIRNLGAATTAAATVIFTADGSEIARQDIAVEKSGIQQVSCTWPVTSGTHTITAEVRHPADAVSSNNIARQEVTVGSLPDLSVTVGSPVRAGGEENAQPSPSGAGIAVSAIALATGALFMLRGPPKKPAAAVRGLTVIAAIMVIAAGMTVIPSPVSADDLTRQYTLPVTVKNIGGSDAGAFAVSVYLDGEKVAVKEVPGGLSSGNAMVADIPLHTSCGSHGIRVIADEEEKVRDAGRENNRATASVLFP